MLSSRSVSLFHDDADAPLYSRTSASKTPGRALKGRAGLQENVFQHGSMTTNPMEKRAVLGTPFHRENSKIILQDTAPPLKGTTLSRPLADKTPHTNRQSLSLFTPLLRNGKAAKLTLPALLDANEDVEAGTPAQPPSSSRKKQRVPRSTSRSFEIETPHTKGDHWNVSDVSIELGGTSLDKTDELAVDINEPDYSEPEYMPPKTIEPTYEPPFELPNYRDAGQTLCTLAHSYPIEEDTSSHIYEVDSEELLKGCGWSSSSKFMNLDLPDTDEDDIFAYNKATKNSAVKPSMRAPTSSMASVKRTASSTAARPAAATSVIRSRTPSMRPARPATSVAIRRPLSKPVSTIPRPGSVAAVRRPLTRNGVMNSTSSKPGVTRTNTSLKIRRPPRATAKTVADELVQSFGFGDNEDLGMNEDFRFDI
ncbi:hypothetical protein EW145_g3530 [Phellinidium pouzarii]|uniref:Uncharacterized protein n=1 Tax=Phellinidium pouzarii TaxID=167371 RepID=A0A4V3XCU8_9AGAM|nr:hypothetical protein EW145_g3530 [Phellinidium pouzarii]